MERYGYKVVTKDMKSLGLRRNPNIMTFHLGEWINEPKDTIRKDDKDFGGIWAARTPGGARKYVNYMKKERGVKGCRIFKARLGNVLYENGDRLKTDAILLVEEIKAK